MIDKAQVKEWEEPLAIINVILNFDIVKDWREENKVIDSMQIETREKSILNQTSIDKINDAKQ